MRIPKQGGIKAPLFSLIVVHGELSPTEAYDRIMNRFKLPKSCLNKLDKSGEPTIKNRIRWACRALREDGLIERTRGVWRLTDYAKSRVGLLAEALVG